MFEVRWNWSNSSLCVVRASNYTGMRVFGRVIDSVQRAGVNDVLYSARNVLLKKGTLTVAHVYCLFSHALFSIGRVSKGVNLSHSERSFGPLEPHLSVCGLVTVVR